MPRTVPRPSAKAILTTISITFLLLDFFVPATAFEAVDYLNRTKDEGIVVPIPTGTLVGIASFQAIQSESRAQTGKPI